MIRRSFLCVTALALLAVAPVFAKDNVPVDHYNLIYSVYKGNTSQPTVYKGYLKAETGSAVYPGVLRLNPPDSTWSNYISAAQKSPKVDYTITNVTLVKNAPEVYGYFSASHVVQSGTADIRLAWPLLYEMSKTTWTLTIDYTTSQPFDDDNDGPNTPSLQHTDRWTYILDYDVSQLRPLLELFHNMPFGTSGVPLAGNEQLYHQYRQSLANAEDTFLQGDMATEAAYLTDFELAVMDSVILVTPPVPNPGGPDIGFAQTSENPAAFKLIVETESVLMGYG